MNKLAVVTGAGQGIGEAIAKRLSDQGYSIAVVDINPQTARKVSEEIKKSGQHSLAYVVDVSNRSAVFSLLEDAVSNLGELGVWVNNAGIAAISSIVDEKPKEFERILDVNIKGTYWGTQAAAKQFIKQGKGGRIINAASLAGVEASALQSAYSASKFAIRGITQAAAKEFAKYKITVNAYNPGVVRTKLRNGIDEATAKIRNRSVPEQKASVLDEIDLHREAKTDDVAKLVSWFALDENDYITGQSIMIDGGMHYL